MAGLWAALLIAVRIFDRPLGQSALALGCAALVAAAGLRERVKRPADDMPGESRAQSGAHPPAQPAPRRSGAETTPRAYGEEAPEGEEATKRQTDAQRTAEPADEAVTSRLDRSEGPSVSR